MADHIPSGSEAILPPVAADHPVLEFLNTVAQIDGKPIDSWTSDESVQQSLIRIGLIGEDAPRVRRLLEPARALRELVRGLVAERKDGRRIDPARLNAFLAKAPSHSELVCDDAGLRVERRRHAKTPEQVLVPVAEAAADLLATGDFNLVRKCEDASCTMWFYDRTKSHRRRWCSMALCGNRHKVAAFRQRRQG